MNRVLTIESQYCLSANTTMPGPGVFMVSSNTSYSANSQRIQRFKKRTFPYSFYEASIADTKPDRKLWTKLTNSN